VSGVHASGYESFDFIENLETIYVVIFMFVGFMVMSPFCLLAGKRWARMKKIYNYWHSMFFWNGILRFLFETYLELSVNTMICLGIVIDHSDHFGDVFYGQFGVREKLSVVMTMLFAIIIVGLPIINVVYLHKQAKYISHI
jgi:hypothetical protein